MLSILNSIFIKNLLLFFILGLNSLAQEKDSTKTPEPFLQESKIMLRHSNWNISEIAYALDFTEVTHFSNFFKKHVKTSPSKFRKG